MIKIEDVIEIHKILIERFGGTSGIRDINLLKSAIERPYSGFGNIEFYPSSFEKAGAIIESIIKNHPFIDGNKRVGYVLMRLLLMQKNYDIKATQDEKFNFVINIANGKMDIESIIYWIKNKSISI